MLVIKRIFAKLRSKNYLRHILKNPYNFFKIILRELK